MKFVAVSSLVVASLLAGCSVESAESEDTSEEAIVRRPAIEFASMNDREALSAKLYRLLNAFKSDLGVADDGYNLTLSGKEPTRTKRSVSCNESDMELVAPGGGGFTHRTYNSCSLKGFDQVRNGGRLPNVVVPYDLEAPLAGKLVTLLEKGAQKGTFGVKKSEPTRVPCCDIPSTVTYELSDDTASLVCQNRTGGFAFIVQASCTYTVKDTSPETAVFTGKLALVAGIGGESTGVAISFDGASAELVLSPDDRARVVDGRTARVTGTRTTLSGVETHDRPAINVSNLLVCPAPGAHVDLMPPVDADTTWIGANCPGLSVTY